MREASSLNRRGNEVPYYLLLQQLLSTEPRVSKAEGNGVTGASCNALGLLCGNGSNLHPHVLPTPPDLTDKKLGTWVPAIFSHVLPPLAGGKKNGTRYYSWISNGSITNIGRGSPFPSLARVGLR